MRKNFQQEFQRLIRK